MAEKKTYSEKLRDPRWQKKRLEILEQNNFTCQLCSDTETELHVHHLFYTKGKQPWEYTNDALVTLCKHCHLLVETTGHSDITHGAMKNILATGEISICRILEGFTIGFYVIHPDNENTIILQNEIPNWLIKEAQEHFKDFL